MKTSTIAAIITLFTTVSVFASDETFNKPLPTASVFQTPFNRFVIDPALRQGEIIGANLKVDRATKTATLNLQPAFSCPAGRMCAMVMPAAIEYELPITRILRGGCGERIYVASEDLRPVDGWKIQLTITDNSVNYCMYLVPVPGVSAVLETESSGMDGTVGKTRSTFESDSLFSAVSE